MKKLSPKNGFVPTPFVNAKGCGGPVQHSTSEKQKLSAGFTLLYSVLVASLLLSLGLAIFNIIIKELTISSTIRDSQVAFSAADAGTECALFWDFSHPGFTKSVFGGPPVSVIPEGLIAYWKMDDGSGSSTALDSSGNSHTGTLGGGLNANSAWVSGKIGTAVEFNGGTNVVVVQESSELFVGNQVSIFAWIWRENTSAIHAIYSDLRGADTPNVEYSVELPANNSNIRFYSNSGETNPNVSVLGNIGSYSTQDWVHVGITWDGSEVRFYKDGILMDTQPFAHSPAEFNGRNYSIGRRTGGAAPFVGRIDELRVYNRPLSQQDVLDIYNASEASFAPVDQNSNIVCNQEDISNPSTGWSPSIGWDISNLTDSSATTVFDMLFENGTCATVTVSKNGGNTQIESRGYNNCDLSNPRRVERGLRITY